ncbi:MAG: tRNA (N6-isopentenyl adenosine(37)-C2)-methylthiotransferase MiaB [Lachnospiraceae bacterium]|nr:tRNA (N6-isopentenyl adenosine(37)-C2)-methylthiotransferase MiaB [Lachnospiraceae bacterium]
MNSNFIDNEQNIYQHAPAAEPERQLYFMEKARTLLKARFESMLASGEALNQYGQEMLDKMISRQAYGTFCIQTFGCQMNAKDSEKLAGILESIGFIEVDTETADFVLYNTCTVRENANLRVYGRLGQLGALKKKHPRMMIALCGCMMQEKEVVEKLKKSYRFVDLIFGTHNIYQLAELIYRRLNQKKMVVEVWEGTDKIVENLPAERKYAFKSGVNIMFGCNNFCSYCIVPYVRGRERSRNPEEIIKEVERLAADGVVEVMLLGQNVNSYGKNLEHPISFAELLRQVEQVEGIRRIRFMTSHPKDLSDELIAVMKESKKICPHLHLPLQSGSSRILKVMNRKYTKEQYLELASKIKKEVPGISLTTDIIVGFPGETEEDFLETMDVVEKVGFDSAFTFIYSKRTGTPAAAMENQVPEAVVKDRFDRLLKLVQETGSRVSGREVHTVQEVLVEEINDHDSSLVTGRLGNNTVVHFPGDASLIGTIVKVSLDEFKGFYYMGTMQP